MSQLNSPYPNFHPTYPDLVGNPSALLKSTKKHIRWRNPTTKKCSEVKSWVYWSSRCRVSDVGLRLFFWREDFWDWKTTWQKKSSYMFLALENHCWCIIVSLDPHTKTSNTKCFWAPFLFANSVFFFSRFPFGELLHLRCFKLISFLMGFFQRRKYLVFHGSMFDLKHVFFRETWAAQAITLSCFEDVYVEINSKRKQNMGKNKILIPVFFTGILSKWV